MSFHTSRHSEFVCIAFVPNGQNNKYQNSRPTEERMITYLQPLQPGSGGGLVSGFNYGKVLACSWISISLKTRGFDFQVAQMSRLLKYFESFGPRFRSKLKHLWTWGGCRWDYWCRQKIKHSCPQENVFDMRVVQIGVNRLPAGQKRSNEGKEWGLWSKKKKKSQFVPLVVGGGNQVLFSQFPWSWRSQLCQNV